MKVEVDIISTEIIKPSSPTPQHLRNYQLSFLDQISPPVYMPFVLFYKPDIKNDSKHPNNDEKCCRLKTSLSETLTRFYPLAGRLIDNSYVDCNDEGVPFTAAHAKSQFLEVVQNPCPSEFNKFLPRALDDHHDNTLLAIQVDLFDCGGLAIGVCTSHKIADGLSIIMMIRSWAATSRGNAEIISPLFESAKIFPPRDLSGFQPRTGVTKDKVVSKMFIFTNSMIDSLRAKFSENLESPDQATRVEALSAFIWNRYAAVTGAKQGIQRLYVLLHAVNLRNRTEPPMPECLYGNLYRIATAIPSMNSEGEYLDVVRKMRETIRNIDTNYVKRLREGDEHLDFIKETAERFTRGEMVFLSFTSLCRLPIYEADFGWGKPVRVGSARLTFSNLVTFMDTRDGDGIEAWMHMEDELMAKLEVDKELLSYTSPKPYALLDP